MEGMGQPTQWSNRVTHIFRLEKGDWRLVHRHANRLEMQYEPATRLQPARST
jgi:ketosteroid isomerase-like protein